LKAAQVLRQIAEEAFVPYWDDTLARRVTLAEVEWRQLAEQALAEQIDHDALEELREEAAEKLTELQGAIDDINERLRLAAGDRFSLPVIEVPEPEVDEGVIRQALVGFNDDWVAATRALIARKAYEASR
jgi:hypothetical protein